MLTFPVYSPESNVSLLEGDGHFMFIYNQNLFFSKYKNVPNIKKNTYVEVMMTL